MFVTMVVVMVGQIWGLDHEEMKELADEFDLLNNSNTSLTNLLERFGACKNINDVDVVWKRYIKDLARIDEILISMNTWILNNKKVFTDDDIASIKAKLFIKRQTAEALYEIAKNTKY